MSSSSCQVWSGPCCHVSIPPECFPCLFFVLCYKTGGTAMKELFVLCWAVRVSLSVCLWLSLSFSLFSLSSLSLSLPPSFTLSLPLPPSPSLATSFFQEPVSLLLLWSNNSLCRARLCAELWLNMVKEVTGFHKRMCHRECDALNHVYHKTMTWKKNDSK